LIRSRGAFIPTDRFVAKVWGINAEDEAVAPENTLAVYICRLRRHLSPFGYGIETAWGKGYRLVRKAI
jgi:DNA-binding response OmpR family regulator